MRLDNGVCYYSKKTWKGIKIPKKFLFKRKGEKRQKIDFVKFMMWYWEIESNKAHDEYKKIESKRQKWVDQYSRILAQYGDF